MCTVEHSFTVMMVNSLVHVFLWFVHCRYAKIHIPIIASVSEHQPTTWTSFFFDLHILLCMFPAGVWFVMKDLKDERLFGILSYIDVNKACPFVHLCYSHVIHFI